ncbi:MAG: hypothetical protein WAV41_03915 [Microgenomates group bacterium]
MNDAYQNQDISGTNPLENTPVETTSKKPLKIPSDPKIRIIIILGAIVFVLLLISLVTTFFRKISPTPIRNTPTPIITTIPLPTENTEVNNIPPELQDKFTQIDNHINTNINFIPPQIDTEIGL